MVHNIQSLTHIVNQIDNLRGKRYNGYSQSS